MRKSQLLKVADNDAFVVGRDYLVRVMKIKPKIKRMELCVTIEHLNREQEGRLQDLALPLPVTPLGRSAAFFRAAGVAVAAGAEIDPNDVLGKSLIVRFDSPPGDDRHPQMSFKPLVQETRNGKPAE